MHDPEFDGFPPKKSSLSAPVAPAMTREKPSRSRLEAFISRLKAFMLLWPVPRRAQAIFAEAFRQGLVAGLPVDRACGLAGLVNPCRRFRHASWQMGIHVRSGYPLEAALAKTGVGVQPSLLVALRTGEEHDCLDEALAAFVSRTGKLTAKTFYRKIGRSPEAIRFAAALAALLRDHRLTVREIRAAGRIAAGGSRRFGRIFEDVAHRMEDGASLDETLLRHPRHFDHLYREILESTRSREEMRMCLERIGRGDL
jgi:type II secretory pathway component PulF